MFPQFSLIVNPQKVRKKFCLIKSKGNNTLILNKAVTKYVSIEPFN